MPPIRVRIPFLRTPSSDSTMHVPFENLKIQSPEHPPASAEGSALEPNAIKGRQRVAEGMIGRRRTVIDMQKAELSTLNSSRERYTMRLKAAKGQIAELEHRLQEDARTYKQAVAKRDQRIQTLEEELARTKELLAARTTELSGAQSFLSTADRRSEADVLGIVRDLNENIFQVAANLTEEWENLRPDKSSRFHIRNDEIDAFSQSFGPALVLHVLDRDPTAVTFLVQSCLCDFAVQVSSSWRYKRGFRTLSSLHKRLSTSEGQAISSRWRSLTHKYLSKPSSDTAWIAQLVADALWLTGSFPSPRYSLDFVKTRASNGLTTIENFAMRLESVFMEDIMSCDMCLLYEPPCAKFDGTTMTREDESDKTPIPKGKDNVAGTTEVGVEKSVCLGQGGGRHTQVLLKTTVVLEKDLVESQRAKPEE